MSSRLSELTLHLYKPLFMRAWNSCFIIGIFAALIEIDVLICLRWAQGSTLSLILVIVITTVASAVGGKWAIRQLAEYWRRNVCGYNLWNVRKPNGDIHLSIRQRFDDDPDGTELEQSWPDELVIILPLGGWFARSWTIIGGRRYGDGRADVVRKELKRIRFRIVDIHVHTGRVIVQWRDHRGDRLTMTVERALERLHEHALDLSTGYSLRDITENERRAWETERERRYETERVWGEAINGLMAGARQIAATSRFSRSKDGQRIRRELANAALAVMSPKDPYRSEAEQLAQEQVPASVKV